ECVQSAVVVVSSSVEEEPRLILLEDLLTDQVVSAVTAAPECDLTVAFESGVTVCVFAVGMPDGPFEGTNWEVWTPTRYIGGGPGFSRTVRRAGAGSRVP